MYRHHQFILILIGISSGVISWLFKIPYEKIASNTITIASITIAIYAITMIHLIGSKVSNIMKKQDFKIKNKTQIGVFISYFNRAILTGIFLIINSCIAKIYCMGDFCIRYPYVYKCISSVGIALFAVTIFFILIIFKFISSILLKEIHTK